MKKSWWMYAAACLAIGACVLSGCSARKGRTGTAENPGAEENTQAENLLTIGFAQVGEESDWRRANSRSIEETFTEEKGYRLLYADAQNDQDKQIRSVQNFIQQEVDYIILEPVVERGWDGVLQEAKEAGIPVIVADRRIDVESEELYLCWIGSDNLLEGQKVCGWLHEWAQLQGWNEEELKVVNIQGTIGSAPQVHRDQALLDACRTYGWDLLAQTRGEFTQAKGREAMEKLLEDYPELNVVYCDNDNEAYGAIEALEEAGRVPGSDIEAGEVMVLAFDATKKAFGYMLEGKIMCDGDCNPYHGPRIEEAIRADRAGEVPEKQRYVEEAVYAARPGVETVTVEGENYPVTLVDQTLTDERVY